MMTIIVFILVLGLLVLVHELGHFIAAKKAGCRVEEFGIGFPPRVFSVVKGETRYGINLLPLGGYVKIAGENGEETDDPRSFVNKSFSWKTLIVSAGVLMNIVLAFILISIGLTIGSPTIVTEDQAFSQYAQLSDEKLQIIEVLPNSPAAAATIQIGDELLSVDGATLASVDDLITELNTGNESYAITIMRNQEEQVFTITPEELEGVENKGIGIGLAKTATISYPWYIAPFLGLLRTGELLWLIVTAFGALLVQLFTTGTPPADVAGPIGIAVITGQVARLGIAQLIQFTALLSLNLAVINILPFPALDGGRLALIVIEKIRKKKVNLKFEQLFHTAGFIALMLLIVVITAKDISTYGVGILDAIKGYFG